jgi:hypothetical protein
MVGVGLRVKNEGWGVKGVKGVRYHKFVLE